MNKKITFLFSGQGSQYHQMGRDLYKSLPKFRDRIHQMDDIYLAKTGRSLVKAIYGHDSGTEQKFDNVLYTHPALVAIQYSLASVLMSEGVMPDRLIGTSLGESVALAVGGVLTPAEMLAITIKQSIILDDESIRGGMIAILESPEFFANNPDIFLGCDLAAVNMQKLICIAGSTDSLKKTEAQLKNKKVIYEVLPVKQPFHSSVLESVREKFIECSSGLNFRKSRMEIVSSMTTGKIHDINNTYSWDVIRKPILFNETIEKISPDKDMIYIDIGPSGTLANLVKYNLPKNRYDKIFSIITPFGDSVSNYKKLINEFHQSTLFAGAEAC
jgi:bacillaene synthase trans-acting acyltransferase